MTLTPSFAFPRIRRLALTTIPIIGLIGTPIPSIGLAQAPGRPIPVGERRDNRDNVVFWSRNDFVIPFNIDTTGQAPREIQLELSEDGGRNWILYSKSDVRTRQFNFLANVDGEYQFRLKTVDNSGRVFDNPGAPLRVVVDTLKPTGELIIDLEPRGDLIAEFRLTDDFLDPNSIRLEYQTESIGEWREILCNMEPDSGNGQWFGTGSWSIPSATRQLVVRMLAKDLAGNLLEITRMPQLPRTAQVTSNLQLASGKPRDPKGSARSPIQSPPVGTGVRESAANDTEMLPRVEVLVSNGSKTIPSPTRNSSLLRNDPQSLSIDSPQRPVPNMSNMSNNEVVSSRGRYQGRPATDEDYKQDAAPKRPELASRDASGGLRVFASDGTGANESSNSRFKPDPQTPIESIPGEIPFRRDIKPLFSNSKSFSLEYSVDNDPGAPIESVELWGTTDSGQTWERWGIDPDRESPFDIMVENEGLFGFRMVIIGANGLASNRPRNGDNADAWIHVDTEQPRVKITSALYGKGSEAGSLVIDYQAIDDYFPDRPIALSYSATPNGPWTMIQSGIRNNGRYVWPSDPSLPATIYLRIQAFDSAGNVGTHRLDLPINVEGIVPRGRIQGFRPLQSPSP